ncbi:hypothetical protein Salat_0662800 [Sesamum alatum]|uniref:Zinc finger, GRF-type n=1 Tax=Sesamum alatum TaxID=300844 RepID=A0AAE1YSR2_9LAMI|nr:hypothetical protein Salat_0662800 [Sesamum alatum]
MHPFELMIRRQMEEVVLWTSWTNNSPEHRFQGCPGVMGKYCGTFQWVDPPMCRRVVDVIPGLLKWLSAYEKAAMATNDHAARLEACLRGSRRMLRLTLIGWIYPIILISLYARRG